MPLCRHSVGTYYETSSHETRRGTHGHSRLSLLRTDPGLKSWINVCELIFTLKKVQAGNESLNILPKFSQTRKKPPPPQCCLESISDRTTLKDKT